MSNTLDTWINTEFHIYFVEIKKIVLHFFLKIWIYESKY